MILSSLFLEQKVNAQSQEKAKEKQNNRFQSLPFHPPNRGKQEKNSADVDQALACTSCTPSSVDERKEEKIERQGKVRSPNGRTSSVV